MRMNGLAAKLGFLAMLAPQAAGADEHTGSLGYQAVVPLLDANKTVLGQELAYPSGDARLKMLVVTLQPGEDTGRHMHPVPVIGYVLEGQFAVQYEGGEEKVFRKGDSFIEAVHTWHTGRVRGDKPARVLAVFIGEETVPSVIRP